MNLAQRLVAHQGHQSPVAQKSCTFRRIDHASHLCAGRRLKQAMACAAQHARAVPKTRPGGDVGSSESCL